MNYFTEKLFNFLSSFNILKIIIIFTLLLNINCSDGMKILISKPQFRANTIPTWDLEVTTTGINQNMTIGFDGPVDMTIYWGDGTDQTTTNTSITHTYSSAGTYTLRLKGMASRISFSNADAQSRLTGILSKVQGITGITSFNHTFRSCSNLQGSIPPGLFDNCPLVTSFSCTFHECSGLTGQIPAGLFDNNPLVTNFNITFSYCSGLSGPIPAGLFDYNTEVTTFNFTFQLCSGLTSVPSGLFDYTTKVTLFHQTFLACTGLTSIPSGLFDYCPDVLEFWATFAGSSIISIPPGLFDFNTKVTNFSSLFDTCPSLTSIPIGLFDNNPLVNDFYSAFARCTGITSAVPELWNTHPGVYGEFCFLNVTNASNYAFIPVGWQ